MTDLPEDLGPGPHGRVTAARSLRRGVDVLVAALVVVAVVAAWHGVGADDEPAWRAVVASSLGALLLGVYAWGAVRSGAARLARPGDTGAPARPTAAGTWVALLGAVWVGLLVAEPAALWLAFPLMFVELHVLPRRAGLVAVGATTLASVLAALARGQHPVGSVLGPVLGALVASGVVLGLGAVARESAQRQRVIDELVRARAQAAAAERAEAVAVERERLAREIHDTLAQGFSSVELLLRSVDTAVADDDRARARDLLATARAEARRNLEEARRFVRALAPPDLDAATLVGALRRVAERAAAAGGPQARVEVSGAPQLVPVPVETALLRVAQSAVANVVQHASAREAVLTVTFLDGVPGEVVLDVVDDGRGFDPAGLAGTSAQGGFGLVAMRSRVRELGGTLVVEAAPGRGTAVSARLPLAPDGAAGARTVAEGAGEEAS